MAQIMCIVKCMVYNETAYTLADCINKSVNKKEHKSLMKKGCLIGLENKNWQPTFENLDKDAVIFCEDENWFLT